MRTFFATAILGAVLAGSLAVAQDKDSERLEPVFREKPAGELRTELRRLWSKHLAATRHSILSSMAGLPDAGLAHRNLLKRQDELSLFFRAHLGVETSKQLAELLREHAEILGDVVRAARGGNRDDLANQRNRWDANGRGIAEALAAANPEWNRGRLEEMVLRHLELTAEEISCRLKKDWVGDLGAHDDAQEHLFRFADILTLGLARRDPDHYHDLP